MPDDLISRSELLAALRQALKDAWYRRAVPMSGVGVILKIIEIVQKAPAVNAQEEDNAEKTAF